MQRSTWIGVFAGGLLATAGWLAGRLPATAKDDEPTPAAGANAPADFPVALVDVNKILKVDHKFKLAMTQIALDVKEAETKLNATRAEINDAEQELAKEDPASGEFARRNDELVKRKSQFNADASICKQHLMDQETAIYAVGYKRICRCIDRYAEDHGLRLVIRYIADEDEPKSREDVAKFMGRPVVYQKRLDITDKIIEQLNGKRPPEGSDDENPEKKENETEKK